MRALYYKVNVNGDESHLLVLALTRACPIRPIG